MARQKYVKQESPIEKLLRESYERFKNCEYPENSLGYDANFILKPQQEIGRLNGHKYFADFYEPTLKIIVELDGYEWHKTKEQINNDRKRELELQRRGFIFIRFTGSQVYLSAFECLENIYSIYCSVCAKDDSLILLQVGDIF